MRNILPFTFVFLIGIHVAVSAGAVSEYEKIVANHPDTAQGHFDIATWCDANRLPAARDTHLRRAISADPDFAPARQALGYIRVGQVWLKIKNADARSASTDSDPQDKTAADAVRSLPKPAPQKPKAPAPRADKDPDKWVRDAISAWRVTLHGIRRVYLMSGSKMAPPASFNTGIERIFAITDPLAIEAIGTVLSAGPTDVRRLMVGALKGFSQDEATLNLIVTALLDPVDVVRRDAIRALAERQDAQMIDLFRMALRSYEEDILTGAAEVLATLKVRDAVPELVMLLKGDRRLAPPVTRRSLFDALRDAYGQPVPVEAGPRRGTHHPKIAVVGREAAIQPARPGRPIVQRRPEFRTAVQEALIELTGQNFGFDAKAWMRWVNRQEAEADREKPNQAGEND